MRRNDHRNFINDKELQFVRQAVKKSAGELANLLSGLDLSGLDKDARDQIIREMFATYFEVVRWNFVDAKRYLA